MKNNSFEKDDIVVYFSPDGSARLCRMAEKSFWGWVHLCGNGVPYIARAKNVYQLDDTCLDGLLEIYGTAGIRAEVARLHSERRQDK